VAPTRRGLLHTEPERMTTRARLFMTVVALRNGAIGASLLLAQRQYGAPNAAFSLVRNAMPIPVWGALMVAIGLTAAYSAVVMSRRWATWAIGLSATISGTWMACFAMQYGILAGTAGGMSPMLPILWGALTAKDLVIAAQPMRSPFEPLIQRLLHEGPGPDGDDRKHMGEVT
jgi:hypothetical protein